MLPMSFKQSDSNQVQTFCLLQLPSAFGYICSCLSPSALCYLPASLRLLPSAFCLHSAFVLPSRPPLQDHYSLVTPEEV